MLAKQTALKLYDRGVETGLVFQAVALEPSLPPLLPPRPRFSMGTMVLSGQRCLSIRSGCSFFRLLIGEPTVCLASCGALWGAANQSLNIECCVRPRRAAGDGIRGVLNVILARNWFANQLIQPPIELQPVLSSTSAARAGVAVFSLASTPPPAGQVAQPGGCQWAFRMVRSTIAQPHSWSSPCHRGRSAQAVGRGGARRPVLRPAGVWKAGDHSTSSRPRHAADRSRGLAGVAPAMTLLNWACKSPLAWGEDASERSSKARGESPFLFSPVFVFFGSAIPALLATHTNRPRCRRPPPPRSALPRRS